MDREWPEEKRQHFLAVASQHPELKGIHDLRTRTSGTHDFVQFHVWVDPAMTVAHAHQVMDEVEEKLAAAFPCPEELINPDPEGHRDLPLGREHDTARTRYSTISPRVLPCPSPLSPAHPPRSSPWPPFSTIPFSSL